MFLSMAIVLVAACAGAQVTENDRICALEALHGIDSGFCAVPPTETCGDGAINQPSEECDGADLGGETCLTQGFDGGTLACAAGCTFDTSACFNNPPAPVCGNGTLETGEECDDGNVLDGDGCSSTCTVEPPPGGGTLADAVWASIPNSEMDTIYDPAIDDIGDLKLDFDAIQGAWGGGVCVGDEMIIMGGGHGDGSHNGVFAVNVQTGVWRRVTLPSPLWSTALCPGGVCQMPNGDTCSFTVDASGSQNSDCSMLPDGNPPSKHTYDTLATDGTFVYALGGSAAPTGNTGKQPNAWRLDPQTGTWTPLPNKSLAVTTHTAFADNKIYYAIPSWGGGYYDIPTNTWHSDVGWTSGWTDVGNVMLYAPVTDEIYIFGGPSYNPRAWSIPRALWADGPLTSYDATGTKAVKYYIGLTYYPPEDLILMWDDGPDVQTFDPVTKEWGLLTPGGVDPGPSVSAGTYERFSYCGGKVVLVNGQSKPLYYLDTGAAPTPPPPGGSASFDERRSAPGVVFADPLDTEGPYDGAGAVLLNDDGSTGIPTESWWLNWRGVQCDGCTKPQLDTTVKASGTGSLKFTVEDGSASVAGGNFATNLSPDFSVQFGEDETFYVQYRWRADCDFIYTDCNPASPTYKTERRAYPAIGGGTTAAKLSIISTGDNDPNGPLGSPSWSQGACTWLELVTFHGPDHTPQAYHSCGWYAGFDEQMTEWVPSEGAYNIQFQPNGDYDCRWHPDPNGPRRTWGLTGPNCFYLDADEWITVQWKIQIGTWQPSGSGAPTSHVTIWMAREGQAQQVVLDHDLLLRGPETAGERYGKVWLLPFMTSKDPAVPHPESHVWYDELIVSTNFIADPA